MDQYENEIVMADGETKPQKRPISKKAKKPEQEKNKDKKVQKERKQDTKELERKRVRRSNIVDDSDSQYDTSDEDEEDEEDYYLEPEEEDEIMGALQNAMKNTIIFTIQAEGEYDEEEDEDWEPEEDENNEDEKKDETKEEETNISEKVTEPTNEKQTRIMPKTRRAKQKAKKLIKKETKQETKQEKKTEDTFDYESAMKQLKDVFDTSEDTPKLMKEKFEELKKEFEKRQEKKKKAEERKERIEHSKTFRSLVSRRRTESDISYFRKLPIEQQRELIKHFKELKEETTVKTPYTIKLLNSSIPNHYKSIALKKVSMLENMEPGMGEYFKVKQWVDMFMNIPFGIHNTLPVNLEKDGMEKCHEFMNKAKETLDNSVYGLNDAKMQVMQMLGQLMTNPSSVGTAIAIKGPMGTGKTTLVKDGISQVLGRPFVFIPLGGATDSSYLEGHSYTYEGSTWGRIIDAIVKCKCMNPVFYFDELDKVSDTPRGEEIIGILTHLTDTTQNSQFHDKYFADLDFDLSKALFIFSYNYEDKINPILRDRMYRIETKGYDSKDKTIIARKYLIPRIIENVCFEKDAISIPDDTLHELISKHTNDEKGVRNLKRCLETIYTKLNLHRLMPKGTKMFDDENTIEVEFPFNVTIDVVKKLLRHGEENQSFMSMYL